ncbi:type II secretion system F family protein [Roseimaritima sediminicola]|uniref:type II secretion system F family protein n=1 Tax=Roseimaritima sediminicola TaxID=2662066 RepID=UPI0012984800|nr:type II secretion system F family protein [Roseimaritima sediminicola]
MMPILVIAAIGIGIAALVAFAVTALSPGSETTTAEERLQVLAARRPKSGAGNSDEPSLLLAGGLDDSKDWVSTLTSSMPALGTYMDQANVTMAPAHFVGICVAAFVGGTTAVFLTPGVPVLLAPLAGLVVGALPLFWLRMKRARRLAQFGRQLPDALELLGRSLRAGHSLAAGFGLIANEMNEPISVEFGRVFQEQNFGIPLEEALDDMASRVPNMDVRFFATAVILQRQTGGDLAEILDKIGHLVRERIQILGQVQALTGEGRLSGIVLLAMPPLLFLVMLWMNKDYVMTLFSDPIGQKLLIMAIITQVVGALVIRKIVTIKV